MKIRAINIEDKVDELLVVLDEDIENIQKNLSRLNELRSLVIKHDDAALSKLLEGIQAETGSNLRHELKRQWIRQELANALGHDIKQMTLSTLETDLPKEKQVQVTRRKAKLTSLIEKLKKEHLSTAMLLADCARFNRLLLKNVFQHANSGTVTYNPKGAAERQGGSAFVNLEY